MSALFFRHAVGALLVFDVTDLQSFIDLPNWIERLKEHTEEDLVIMLIGNKADLSDKRAIEYEKAAKFAFDSDMGY